MPLFSFIAYSKPERKKQLMNDISKMEYCEVRVADNQDMMLLFIDAPDEKSGNNLINKIKGLDSLQSLNMTFGYTD
jgi:nitrate reductase NapAB chaperone NapD